MAGVVYLIDDDSSFRAAIQRRLERAGYRVVAHPSAEHLLDQRPDESLPGCILLDVRMPGLDGLQLQSRLTELGWTLPIVFLTGYPDASTVVKAIKAGADNFLVKPVSSHELLGAIEKAIARYETEHARNSELEAIRARLSTLTARQRQVFEIIVRGKPNKFAARELGCSERTIKAHRQVVMEKMQVQSVAQLATLAERLGASSPVAGERIRDTRAFVGTLSEPQSPIGQ